jgi:hypothetical protein
MDTANPYGSSVFFDLRERVAAAGMSRKCAAAHFQVSHYRVDGLHPHQNACETDNGVIADRGLLTSHGDALEPFQFAHRLFDAGTRPVQHLREELRPALAVGAVRNNRNDPALAASRAVRL